MWQIGKKESGSCTRLFVDQLYRFGTSCEQTAISEKRSSVLACDKKLYVKNYVKYEKWNDVIGGRGSEESLADEDEEARKRNVNATRIRDDYPL